MNNHPPPPTNPKAARETADVETASDGYARRFSGAVGQWMLGVQEQIVLALLAHHPGATVLDVGGGHGQLALPLARRGYAVTVLGSGADAARQIEPAVQNGLVRFQAGNLLQLPFADASFDTAISFRLLPHCVLWPALVRELCRVARRAVIVDYPTSRSINCIADALFRLKKGIEKNTRPFAVFRDHDVEQEFARNGFHLHDRRPEFFVPMALHRALNRQRVSAALERAACAAGGTRRWGSPVIVEMMRSSAPPS